jgi:hypothetical protein
VQADRGRLQLLQRFEALQCRQQLVFPSPSQREQVLRLTQIRIPQEHRLALQAGLAVLTDLHQCRGTVQAQEQIERIALDQCSVGGDGLMQTPQSNQQQGAIALNLEVRGNAPEQLLASQQGLFGSTEHAQCGRAIGLRLDMIGLGVQRFVETGQRQRVIAAMRMTQAQAQQRVSLGSASLTLHQAHRDAAMNSAQA